jgi:hypothetical protein
LRIATTTASGTFTPRGPSSWAPCTAWQGAALVIARLSDTGARVLFMLLFGLGSVAAMSIISGVAGWPLARLARSPAASRVLLAVTGAISVAVGVSYLSLVAEGWLQ